MPAQTGAVFVEQNLKMSIVSLWGFKSIVNPSHIEFTTNCGLLQMLICASKRLGPFLGRDCIRHSPSLSFLSFLGDDGVLGFPIP